MTCAECGAIVPDDKRYCPECGKQISEATLPEPVLHFDEQPAQERYASQPAPETYASRLPPVSFREVQPEQEAPRQNSYSQQGAPPPAYSQPPTRPVYAPDAEPPYGSPYAVAGTGVFVGLMILFGIPGIGFIACIIMSFAARNRNIRNFARAELVLLLIGFVMLAALFFLIRWVLGLAAEFIQSYVNNAVGSAVSDITGFDDLMDILSGLNIPGLTGR